MRSIHRITATERSAKVDRVRFYDGQMPAETVDFGTTNTVTRNFVGARGIEAIFTTTPTSDTTSYPLYDAHGNMTSTLSKAGNSYVNGNVRTYDVWGGIRTGAQTGGPNNRYCASLGHVQDDESGLIYMRARYYESRTGRFISEDMAGDSPNRLMYADNAPTFRCDFDGHFAINGGYQQWYRICLGVGISLVVAAFCSAITQTQAGIVGAMHCLNLACIAFALGSSVTDISGDSKLYLGVVRALMSSSFQYIIAQIAGALGANANSVASGLASAAIVGVTTYTLVILAALVMLQVDEDN